MARTKQLTSLLPTALTLLILGACGPAPHLETPAPDGVEEKAQSARATLGVLRRHRLASEVSQELARTESWLNDVDQRIADGDADEQSTKLPLLAARTQLSAIKTFYQRREAERAVERAEHRLDDRRDSVDELELELEELRSNP